MLQNHGREERDALYVFMLLVDDLSKLAALDLFLENPHLHFVINTRKALCVGTNDPRYRGSPVPGANKTDFLERLRASFWYNGVSEANRLHFVEPPEHEYENFRADALHSPVPPCSLLSIPRMWQPFSLGFSRLRRIQLAAFEEHVVDLPFVKLSRAKFPACMFNGEYDKKGSRHRGALRGRRRRIVSNFLQAIAPRAAFGRHGDKPGIILV